MQKQKTPIAANVRGFRFYILRKSEIDGFCVIRPQGALSFFGEIFYKMIMPANISQPQPSFPLIATAAAIRKHNADTSRLLMVNPPARQRRFLV
ncbi:hypothetical protein ACK861_004780, partial [Salmonella enterica]